MAGAFQSDAFERDAFQEGTSLTAADAVTTSDAPTRTQVLVRSASDAVTSSDSVARAGVSVAASDAVSSSDSVVSARAVSRTASDTVTSSASPTRSAALHRTAPDAVASSDANVAIRTIDRTASDAVTVSESAVVVRNVHRAVADAVTISSSITRSGSFTYTVSDNLSTLVRAGAAFPAPPAPGSGVDVAIYVGGVDITADVVFESCRFTSYVNSKPGDATMRVRDSGRTYAFTTGADWLVMVNGDAAWRGFLVSKVDTYIAPALDVADFGPTRFFDLVGADMNILFSRRVVYDQRNPTNVAGTQFAPGTADTTAITELLDNWLLLTGDQLDTSTGVTNVGSLDPAQLTRAWSGGWYWGNAMDTIAMLPAAIYYLRPEYGLPKATLCYVDVDIPTAPFGLSDIPNGTTTKGYREMEITLDGTSMANDVMAWGMGYGSTAPVFDRETDSTSQTDHGLWQTGVIANGVYKQATIDRIATSIIDGSLSSKRGAKNDKSSVRLVTYDPGLLAGHVVSFTSHIWGFSDAIPVRQMTLLFEAPDVARYEVVLSHEIDAPWGFIDQFWPVIPGGPGGGQPCPNPPCITTWPPPPTDCGITDTFDRSDAASWGTSDALIPWHWSTSGAVSTDGDKGLMTSTIANTSISEELDHAFTSPAVAEVTFTCNLDSTDLVNFPGNVMVVAAMTLTDDAGLANTASVAVTHAKTLVSPFVGTFLRFFTQPPIAFDTVPCPILIDKNTVYRLKFAVTSSGFLQARVWLDGDFEPVTWVTSTLVAAATPYTHFFLSMQSQQTTGLSMTVAYNDLDIAGVNSCTVGGTTQTQIPTAPGGYGCEYPTRSSSTVYATRATFVPGTTFAWRDGLFQRRGTDYTESSGNNSITFSDAVTTSEVIRMCYFSQGPGT